LRPFQLLLVALLDSAWAGSPAPAGTPEDVARGASLFARCGACHSAAPGENRIGPPLAGVVGRKAGSAAGFAYSPALHGSSTVWTPEMLDAFLKAPATFAPGTRMILSLPRPDDRRAIIAYLSSISPPK